MNIEPVVRKGRAGLGNKVNGFQVRCFDVGDAIEERYTVVLMSYYPPDRAMGARQRVMWAMKGDGAIRQLTAIADAHLGHDLDFTQLPPACQEAVLPMLQAFDKFRRNNGHL